MAACDSSAGAWQPCPDKDEEQMDDPFNNINSDGEELALAIGTFSDSDDESFTERPVVEDTRPLCERFAGSLEKLRGVRRHNHRDRSLSELPRSALAPAPEMLESGGPLVRIDVSTTSASEFREKFSATCQPCMITGVPEGWRASERWSSCDAMLSHYGDVPFKVSEIAAPFVGAQPLKIELPLRLYVEQAEEVAADFPFYVFERVGDMAGPRAALFEDFEVPHYFRDDLYDLTEYTRAFFPLYRYIVLGVERTGSNLHVDPSCTSAWNTLLCGVKRWALFPPGDSDEYRERIGAPPRAGRKGDAPPPANWWLDVLPRLKETGADKELGMIECVQRPGETIFVPYGWWHCVLNIGFCTAVTQNLVPPEALPQIWDEFEKDWPNFAPEFAAIVKQKRPDVELPPAAQAAAAREEARMAAKMQASGEDEDSAEQ
eukprot:TRINITY_DN71156_c0_g1_i1.p1 TRINITY_DN71156_c0_g1~~TRINITY_DN71156_c0_g1_i1.p1  ORF type:complete len:432 (+),score=68.96 TRINITY_DN71156_c0_g1_i1:51-1346(+)